MFIFLGGGTGGSADQGAVEAGALQGVQDGQGGGDEGQDGRERQVRLGLTLGVFLRNSSLDPYPQRIQCWGSVTFWCGSGSPDPYRTSN